jgi:hypothetical protein
VEVGTGVEAKNVEVGTGVEAKLNDGEGVAVMKLDDESAGEDGPRELMSEEGPPTEEKKEMEGDGVAVKYTEDDAKEVDATSDARIDDDDGAAENFDSTEDDN